MASETMESVIAMEVASIRDYVEEMIGYRQVWDSNDRRYITQRLDNIERTLNEGDPHAAKLS
jgi:hypothetical protein